MDRLEKFIEHLYDSVITNDFDRIMPVIGSEGVGKSTLMLECAWLYEDVRGNEPSPERVLEAVVFDSREAFREKLLSAEPGDPIIVMDAAHVLHNREQMSPDQIETEKTLLDIRIENYFIMLGYQSWSDMPRQLRARRAQSALYLPQRGYVQGFNRKQLDEKYDDLSAREWPDPALRDTFPSLEGTDLWDRFQQVDKQRKRSRLETDEEAKEGPSPQEVVRAIEHKGPGDYVEVNEFQDRAYFSTDLIQYDYPELSNSEAGRVQSALTREHNAMDYVDDDSEEVENDAGDVAETHT